VKFEETRLKGAFLIRATPFEDERGFFARTYCEKEFASHGLNPRVVQCSVSYSRKRGTLRGLHFQKAPHREAKLIRCARGAIYDVIVDLRPESSTFCQWLSVNLSAAEAHPLMLYVPEGFAHGFQTLEDHTEVHYQMSEFYQAESASGVRWNDPAFSIDWPISEVTMSNRDANYPDFRALIETGVNGVS